MTAFIVFQPWRDVRVGVQAGYGHRGDTVLRHLVTQVVLRAGAVGPDALHYGKDVRVDGGDRLRAVGERLVGEEDHRALVFLRQSEREDADPEAVLHGGRRQDDARQVSVTTVEGVEEVALLKLGGHAGAGSGALGVNDDDRDLRHGGQPQQLRHQGEAGPGGRGHRLRAGVSGADDGGDRRHLVLRLEADAAEAGQLAGHRLQDVGRGRDRVAGEVAASGVQGAGGDGVVPAHDQPRHVVGGAQPVLVLFLDLLGVFVAVTEGLDVLLHEIGAPLVARLHHLFQRRRRQPEQSRHHAKHEDVGAADELQLVAGDVLEAHAAAHEAAVGLRLNEVGVVEEDAAFVQVLAVQLIRLLVEGDEDVAAVTQGVDGPVGDADLEPGVAALNLGGVGAEGEGVEAYTGGGHFEVLAGTDDTAYRGVAAYSDDEIVSGHGRAPLLRAAPWVRGRQAEPNSMPERHQLDRGQMAASFAIR